MNEWRIRAGDYRIIYTIEDTTKAVDVTAGWIGLNPPTPTE